jgi:predicted GIY-YIG superfamily endonuclease
VKSTSPYVPWEFVWACEKPTRAESMNLERKLKNLSRTRIIAFMKKYTQESLITENKKE